MVPNILGTPSKSGKKISKNKDEAKPQKRTKAFLSVDSGDGYINDIHVTPANVSEINEFDEITKNVNAKRVLSDKGYASAKNRDSLRARGIKNGVMYKSTAKKELKPREKLFNRLVSKSRYVVERTIGTLKNHFCCGRARYIGLAKVKAQLFLKAICHNLLKAVNKIELIKPTKNKYLN